MSQQRLGPRLSSPGEWERKAVVARRVGESICCSLCSVSNSLSHTTLSIKWEVYFSKELCQLVVIILNIFLHMSIRHKKQQWSTYWQKMNEKNMTVSDLTMQKQKHYITHVWQEIIKSSKNEVKHYFNHRTELVLFYNILLKGEHVIIPAQLRTNIVEKIYTDHQGQEKCKCQSRLSVFIAQNKQRYWMNNTRV